MTGELFFNEHDAFTDYGVFLRKGAYPELTKIPGAWPDELRQIALPIAIYSNDEIDYAIKFAALRTFLRSNESFVLYSKPLNLRLKLDYQSISGYEFLTKYKSVDPVATSMVLNLEDDYPDTAIATRTANFISAINGQTVSFTRIYTSYTLADANALKAADTDFNADGQAYADGYVNSGITPTPPTPSNPDQLSFTCASYAAMVARIAAEITGILYIYTIKADEVNGGGTPAQYMRYNGQFIRLIPQQAIL